MKKLVFLIILLQIILNCQGDIESKKMADGIYRKQGTEYFDAIGFGNEKCFFIHGGEKGDFSFDYEIRKNIIYIKEVVGHPAGLPFEIIDSKTLKCDSTLLSFGGIYKRN